MEKEEKRAKIEIFEQVVMVEDEIKFLKSIEKIKISSTQYENYEQKIFSFLFETKQTEIKLNCKNSEFKGINVNELKNHETVPELDKILFSLL